MLAIGLISGTSADGIDAALLSVEWEDQHTPIVHLLAFHTYPYPTEVYEEILAVSDPRTGTVDRICRLNFLLGELFAQAALQIAAKGEVKLDEITVIGSHGQTIHHLPVPTGIYPGSTLQIGEPAVIAERTGITTVANFRPRDIAAGGEGAPLAPYGHYLLFGRTQQARSIHNIGGISNLTFLPASGNIEEIIAFDTGPGNMLLDGIIALATGKQEKYDRDGALAAQGQVYLPLLQFLLSHPYLQRTPPKTTGREDFGAAYLSTIWEKGEQYRLAVEDLMATVTAFTAETIIQSYQRFILPQHTLHEVVLCGGGSKNATLCRLIAEGLSPIPVRTTAAYQIDPDALEAIIFALLACETLAGRPGNLPTATGARQRVILGNITPGRPKVYL